MNKTARESSVSHERTIPQDAAPTIQESDPTLLDAGAQQRSFMRLRVGNHLADAIEQVLPPDSGPRLIAKGGEHLVFEVPKKDMPDTFRDIVVKVNFYRSGGALFSPMKDPVAFELQLRQALEESIIQRRVKVLELRKYFGYDAVPAQKTFIRDVPVTPEILTSLYPGARVDAKRVPKTMPALVSVQRRLELSGEGEQYVSLTEYYPERQLVDSHADDAREQEEAYDFAHDLLTGRREQSEDPCKDIESICRLYPEMRLIARLVDQDPAFKKKLGDVVERLILYSRDTHRCLDLAGHNNMTLMKSGDSWKLKMLDVLNDANFSFDALDRTIVEMQEHRASDVHGLSLQHEEAGKALNPLNTLRVINALAFLSGHSEDILKISGIEQIPASVWREGISAYVSSR